MAAGRAETETLLYLFSEPGSFHTALASGSHQDREGLVATGVRLTAQSTKSCGASCHFPPFRLGDSGHMAALLPSTCQLQTEMALVSPLWVALRVQ